MYYPMAEDNYLQYLPTTGLGQPYNWGLALPTWGGTTNNQQLPTWGLALQLLTTNSWPYLPTVQLG